MYNKNVHFALKVNKKLKSYVNVSITKKFANSYILERQNDILRHII